MLSVIALGKCILVSTEPFPADLAVVLLGTRVVIVVVTADVTGWLLEVSTWALDTLWADVVVTMACLVVVVFFAVVVFFLFVVFFEVRVVFVAGIYSLRTVSRDSFIFTNCSTASKLKGN
jgi:hypothetical protein